MHGQRRRMIAGSLSVLAVLAVPAGFAMPAQAEDFPAHPVRIITDWRAGQRHRRPMRIIAEGLSRIWGQQAVVINQPGAGGAIAARTAATASPDGYTLGIVAVSAFVAAPGTADNLPIQVPQDFVPVGYIGGAPMFITAAPWLDVKTLPELIALAKQKPGELSYGVNGIGRLTHLTGELLQSRAGIKLLMVPYSGGTPQVLNDMMGKRVALAFDSYSGIAGAVEAKNAIPLAVGRAQRMAVLPDLPTVAETLPGFRVRGLADADGAGRARPTRIVQKAQCRSDQGDERSGYQKEACRSRPRRPAMSPAETLAFIQREQQKWAPIVQQIASRTDNKCRLSPSRRKPRRAPRNRGRRIRSSGASRRFRPCRDGN